MSQPIEPRRPTVLDPTYARPEPWFVGNGRGLMIAVLSLVALVVLARGVTTWWAIEDAWAWWQSRPATVPVSPPVTRLEPMVSPPPVPPADPRLARRALRGDPSAAFGPENYPVAALRDGMQGRVVARLFVGPNGVPTGCVVEESSGHDVLDEQTCAIATARVRYQPARNGAGRPIAASVRLPVRWRLPEQ